MRKKEKKKERLRNIVIGHEQRYEPIDNQKKKKKKKKDGSCLKTIQISRIFR